MTNLVVFLKNLIYTSSNSNTNKKSCKHIYLFFCSSRHFYTEVHRLDFLGLISRRNKLFPLKFKSTEIWRNKLRTGCRITSLSNLRLRNVGIYHRDVGNQYNMRRNIEMGDLVYALLTEFYMVDTTFYFIFRCSITFSNMTH